MTKTDRHTIAVARFATEHRVTVDDVIELCRLARRAFRAGERACNAPDPEHAEQRAATKFERLAQQLGFTVDWPGLWPVLHRDGRDIYLPVQS